MPASPLNNLDLRGAVPLCHAFLRQIVRKGDRVLDATCGNGNDTLLLAQLVGGGGMVWGFDLQQEAIAATDSLLRLHGCRGQVELLHAGHEELATHISEPLRAVVFNLGYLPGGDKGVVTRPESTISALKQALELLLPGGLLLIVLYTGHPGALEECGAIKQWAASLSPKSFHVWRSRQLNRPETAPYLVLVEKA
ncbi:MAG: methyltransferase domain-containing protein [Geobacter sp.]|nr:methyltransferase domain-containing protein [Geobacter sp.]